MVTQKSMSIYKRKSFIALVIVLGIALSCNLPASQGSGSPDLTATVTAQILPPPADQTMQTQQNERSKSCLT